MKKISFVQQYQELYLKSFMKRSYINILVCIGYGIVTLMQMLNNKYLFNTMNFKFYSLSFFILGAFAAFKKLSIVFVMIVGFIVNSPHKLQTLQYFCVFGITVGALMVGYKDFLGGNVLGYLAVMGSLLSQAVALHYARNLALNDGFTPSQLLFYSAILSQPYYVGTMIYGDQISGFVQYMSNVPEGFYGMFALMLVLGPTSQLAVNEVTMRISPFQKSTISNIKDIFLVYVSIKILRDFNFMVVPLTGTFLIFFCSILFSLPDLFKDEQKQSEFDKLPQNEDEQQKQNKPRFQIKDTFESVHEEQKKCDDPEEVKKFCSVCQDYY